jgi:hypothetical protein
VNFKGKEEEILQRQAATIANDYGMQLLRQKLGRLLEKLRKSGITQLTGTNLNSQT